MSATTRRAPTQRGLSPVKDLAAAAALGRSRRRSDAIVRTLSLAATAIGLLFLASILATLFVKGFGALNLSVFTEVTRPPGSNGGGKYRISTEGGSAGTAAVVAWSVAVTPPSNSSRPTAGGAGTAAARRTR